MTARLFWLSPVLPRKVLTADMDVLAGAVERDDHSGGFGTGDRRVTATDVVEHGADRSAGDTASGTDLSTAVELYNYTGSVDVVADLVGYYIQYKAPDNTGQYTVLTPTVRVARSRPSAPARSGRWT